MNHGHFSIKSDVWSFGITAFETLCYGQDPYDSMTNSQVVQVVVEGKRLNKPEICPEELYELLLDTWEENPDDRPSFKSLHSSLRKIKQHLDRKETLRPES